MRYKYFTICKQYIYIYITFIHLSTPLRRLTTMSFHLFLSSAALFTPPQASKSDQPHTPFIHILIGQPILPPPSTLPSSTYRRDKPLEPPAHIPHTQISPYHVPCEMQPGPQPSLHPHHETLCSSNLSRVSFC